MNESPLTLTLSEAAVEAIAQRAAEMIVEQLGTASGSPWPTREQAAAHLSVPVSRLEKDKTVPAHRWDGRVLYNRGELDEWLLEFGREG